MRQAGLRLVDDLECAVGRVCVPHRSMPLTETADGPRQRDRAVPSPHTSICVVSVMRESSATPTTGWRAPARVVNSTRTSVVSCQHARVYLPLAKHLGRSE